MDEETPRNIMTQALFGDSGMLSAVASLLRQHNGTKEKEVQMSTPMLVLTSVPGKDSLHANVVLGSALGKTAGMKLKPDAPTSTEPTGMLSSLEEVHALATASLVASTQRDIAQQLAQEADGLDTPRPSRSSREKKTRQLDPQAKRIQVSKAKQAVLKTAESKVTSEMKTNIVEKTQDSVQPKALTCSFEGCNRKFAWQNHLKYHELTHTNNRQHKCPVEACDKTFFTAQRLNVHLRTHTGERPFACSHPDCGKSFTTAGNLKNHQRIHTGEQPFVCDHRDCSRRFTEQSSLSKHKRTHSGDKPFHCEKCNKTFTQSGSLRKHMLRHQLDEDMRRSSEHASDRFEEEVAEKSHLSRNPNSSPGSCGEVSCSPQVLVLNNSYQGLPTSESMVFSHGLSEHIVTVSGQSMEHTLARSLLNTHGVQEGSLPDKSDELLVLSEAGVYEAGGAPGDIVYATDILDHEEVTHASYVTTQVDYAGHITHADYPHHEEVTGSEDLHQSAVQMGLSEYVSSGCSTDKDMTSDCLHLPDSELIGAEEVTVAAHYSLSSPPPTPTLCRAGDDKLVDSHHFSHPSDGMEDDGVGNGGTIGQDAHPHRTSLVGGVGGSGVSEGGRGSGPHQLSHSPGHQEMHMDPMMECDEEPEKSM
ncbi:zinc finger protein 143 [Aplysia californica]|uniref:Zinc finger protein 143 n=1 Tax=Aplysia californica TaxID=6500 RepID=A0ABM1W3D8_APLCA|nr:zinc finger protein 143 [Aplysia californica]XP_035829180.1 zinc finger protein 143 [Aplysia californica]XP_035829181.1 zinc finger protein 143 [Aplysia californica]